MDAEQPTVSSRWRVDPETAWTWADEGTAVLMAMSSGRPQRLSPSATLVWSVLVEDRTPEQDLSRPPLTPLRQDELIAAVAEAVGISPTALETDIAAFLARLEQHGIVSPMEPH